MNAATLCHAVLLTAMLASLEGCVRYTSESNVPVPPSEGSFLAAEAGSDAESGGYGAELTTSAPEGYLLKSTEVTVISPDAKRVAIGFESTWGAAELEQAIGARYRRGDAVRGRSTSSTIPLLWGSEQRLVLSENAFFNEQVLVADRDRNRTVSDDEARWYSQGATQVASR